MIGSKNSGVWLLIFALIAILFFLANLWYGSVLISWADVFSALTGQNASGEITDVIVEYPDDFTLQMLNYAKNYSFLPDDN